ncbi:Fps/Fes/Fer/CIP4 homology [Penicillium brevicompactum]
MPGTLADGPTVSMSFANNFWGRDDAGLQPMLDRVHGSKITNDELKVFYNIRASIEDEYARKLQALCRKSLGSCEIGSLRSSLDVVRGETEAIAKAHAAIAGQMKTELEEPLSAFASGIKERRKIIQQTIERLHKTKMQQTQTVNKTRDRYEQDCLRIKGYLAQGHMVMGQEERKNKAKLEKTQVQMASNSNEYEAAVKTLEETTGRWNKEWKSACDKFQDLEEERLDFTKSSLWTYANIASTVCVSDDASCEKVRLSLENCEVEKDILFFIKEQGTGQEIPDPPRFINFCKDDDSSSEMDEGDGYSVAQFQRTMNPAFRTSSPQPSTFDSHNDPQSELAAHMGHAAPPPESNAQPPMPAQMPPTQAPPAQMPPPQMPPQMPPAQMSPAQMPPAQMPPPQMPAQMPQHHPQHQHRSQQYPQEQPHQPQQPAPLDFRRGGAPPPNYDPEQHGEIGAVPHNAYPTDGMTMFCRAGPPSERSSATSAYRPSSRDSQSEVSNPTSMSSVEATPTKKSIPKPTNSAPLPSSGDEKSPKKKSAFFSNSPFRRKSRHDKERPVISSQHAASSPQATISNSAPRGGWDSPTKQMSPTKQVSPPKPISPPKQVSAPKPASPPKQASPPKPVSAPKQVSPPKPVNPPRQVSPPKQVSPVKPITGAPGRLSGSPEPVDPRANFQLNVGNNVFDVASPEKDSSNKSTQPAQGADDDLDPIARALADLKTSGKQSATRVSADRYHGISTPTPSAPNSTYGGSNASAAAPPAYNDPAVKRLGAPQPAFTAKQMHKTTQKYTGQTQNMFRGANSSMGSRHSGQPQEAPRARSPAPAPRRSVSPQVASPRVDTRMSQNSGRGPSPSPSSYQSNSMRSQYSASPTPRRTQDPPYSPNEFARRASPAMSHRAVSPQPQFRQQTRPSSAGGMELQLSNSHDMYGASSPGGYAGSVRSSGRPSSTYGDSAPPLGRSRSRTMAVAEPGRKFSRDGRPILHFARAMYSYNAAIPEELGFGKGDVLGVLRLQDDGWWEAEVTNARGHPGLVPSNYLQII